MGKVYKKQIKNLLAREIKELEKYVYQQIYFNKYDSYNDLIESKINNLLYKNEISNNKEMQDTISILKDLQYEISYLNNMIDNQIFQLNDYEKQFDNKKIDDFFEYFVTEYKEKKAYILNNNVHKIAFFTPLTPLKNGIADFSESLLLVLKDFFDIDIFIDDGYISSNKNIISEFKIYNYKEYDNLYKNYDCTIYQVGNNPDHVYMLNYILEYPGIIELHDFMLGHLLSFANNDIKNYAYKNSISRKYPEINYENPLNKYLIDKAVSVIVHNDYTRLKLIEQNSSINIDTINLFAFHNPNDEVNVKEIKKEYNLSNKFILGIFGFVKEFKVIEPTINAFGKLCAEYSKDKLLLVIVGGIENQYKTKLIKLIKKLNIQKNVKFLGFTDEKVFNDYLLMSDICINLRYPYGGESSSSVARMLGIGKPIIVTDIGSFSDIPDNACVKIKMKTESTLEDGIEAISEELMKYTDDIYDALNNLMSDEQLRYSIGMNAHKYVKNELDINILKYKYERLIKNHIKQEAKIKLAIKRVAEFICFNSFYNYKNVFDYAVEKLFVFFRNIYNDGK